MEISQRERAAALRALHDSTLVLPNAWDAASAAVIAGAGAAAIATTSGGMAWSAGRPDGQALTREEMAELVARIARTVDVPVTADIEGGYGPTPDDVAATVRAVIDAGAVGVNIEDSRAPGQTAVRGHRASRTGAGRPHRRDGARPARAVDQRPDRRVPVRDRRA